MQYEQQQQQQQQHYQQRQEIQQQLLQQQHLSTLQPQQQPVPLVPQPGSDITAYDSQWPPLPTVIPVIPASSVNTFQPSMNAYPQQAYGRPPFFQGQGAAGSTAANLCQETALSSSGRSSIDRNG
jgi:hypothetical protein